MNGCLYFNRINYLNASQIPSMKYKLNLINFHSCVFVPLIMQLNAIINADICI